MAMHINVPFISTRSSSAARRATWFVAAAVVLIAAPAVAARSQLATRAAEEWIKTLDSPARVSNMKIGEMMAALKIRRGQTVADIGAGSGVLSGPLALETGPTGVMYAVDIDKQLLSHIAQRAAEQKIPNIKTVLGEFTDPKLPAPIDLAFINDVLHHIENRAVYLRSLASYVKPGGRIAVVDYRPEKSSHRAQPELVVSEQQTDDWMRASGLRLAEKIDLFEDRFFVIYVKQ
jgi:ubiquinone/menaquinone biosynthesis C-methylase UbiE